MWRFWRAINAQCVTRVGRGWRNQSCYNLKEASVKLLKIAVICTSVLYTFEKSEEKIDERVLS